MTNQDYYVTAGVEFGNEEHIWITQAKVSTDLSVKVWVILLQYSLETLHSTHVTFFQTYDSTIELVSPPDSLRKGDSEKFVVNAYITEPSADIEFGVYQPLGYNVSSALSSKRFCSSCLSQK